MATTIRLEHLMPQGMPDEPGCSFTVSKETYDKLPLLPENHFKEGDWWLGRSEFHEVFRGSNIYRSAVKLYKEDDVVDGEDILDNQVYWYLVWIREEEVWVAFEYYDLASMNETYNATVRVSLPHRGRIYRLNNHAKQLVELMYPSTKK